MSHPLPPAGLRSTQVLILVLTLYCVSLGKLLNQSEVQFLCSSIHSTNTINVYCVPGTVLSIGDKSPEGRGKL